MQSMHNKSMILVKMPVIISSGFVYFSEDERVVWFLFIYLFFNPLFPVFFLFIYFFAVDFYLCIQLGVEFKFEQTKFKNYFEFNVFI